VVYKVSLLNNPFPELFGKKDCKPIIKYNATTGKAEGINIFEKVKLGAINIDQKVLQTAEKFAQIYDLYRVSNCEKLKGLREGSPQWIIFANEQRKNETKLIQLWTLLEFMQHDTSGEIAKQLAKWIAESFTTAESDAPIIPESGLKGAEISREPPPSIYNDIKAHIGEVRGSSKDLDEAFKNPVFDINEVYRINLE